ncbi:hypothetical protein [Pseudoalteromonas sp. SR41-7]|uniref:hypothetical protein n=1 Tax=Pseudoalteromonas sp. SR41-7 TaxID=2760947 RepID=UPI0016022A59|nr:hypothetical protein [Pseudoalteromonas sp. SR41-7]MBB1299197.1 hypothetical protein [Pseudoalteromonas sp. SR41-7]
MVKCWICPNEANSKEHIIKKSDLIRVYGKGPYKGDLEIVHDKNGEHRRLQGPDAKRIKYAPSLCHECNTGFTQPFDRAYDKFIDYVYQNESDILRKRFIDFTDVYGDDFEEGLVSLYRYLAKSFGCRLYDAGQTVPDDIITLLRQAPFKTRLRLTLAVNEDILLMSHEDRKGFIGKGDLGLWTDRENPSVCTGYTWSEHVSWFLFNYWYIREPDGSTGSTWYANSRFVYLGAISVLSEKERNEMISNANKNI